MNEYMLRILADIRQEIDMKNEIVKHKRQKIDVLQDEIELVRNKMTEAREDLFEDLCAIEELEEFYEKIVNN
jgi:predicted  nucleic acid-binding Zn-ribbon protein